MNPEWFSFIFGLALIVPVLAITFYRRNFRNRDDVIQTKAYVVENIYTNNIYYPVIEFTTEDGERHKYKSSVGTSPPRVKEDTYTTIYYLRNNPRKYILNGGLVHYLFGGILSLLGFVACFFSGLDLIGQEALAEKIMDIFKG